VHPWIGPHIGGAVLSPPHFADEGIYQYLEKARKMETRRDGVMNEINRLADGVWV